jgi:hypothetical protein
LTTGPSLSLHVSGRTTAEGSTAALHQIGSLVHGAEIEETRSSPLALAANFQVIGRSLRRPRSRQASPTFHPTYPINAAPWRWLWLHSNITAEASRCGSRTTLKKFVRPERKGIGPVVRPHPERTSGRIECIGVPNAHFPHESIISLPPAF